MQFEVHGWQTPLEANVLAGQVAVHVPLNKLKPVSHARQMLELEQDVQCAEQAKY